MLTRDLIQRMIEQLAAALARIAGFRARGQTEEALREIEAAYDALLAMPPGLPLALDAPSLLALLGHERKAEALADLMDAEAGVREDRGETALAARLRERAGELRRG